MPPFDRVEERKQEVQSSEYVVALAGDLWSREKNTGPALEKVEEQKKILSDVSSGVVGDQLETAARKAFKEGDAFAISSLLNPLNNLLKKQNSEYQIFCPGIAARRNNLDDKGALLLIIARNQRESDLLAQDYFKNDRTHSAITRGKVLEIRY
jgi:hypothetical protein